MSLRTALRRCLVVAIALPAVTACSPDHSRSMATAPPTPTTTMTTAPATDARVVGSPPDIPWWSRGRLHADGAVIRTPMSRIVSRGGTTLIGRKTRHGSRWTVLRELGPLDLFSTRTEGARPVLSANGRFAAWTTSTVTHRYDESTADTAFTVTAYDVGRGRVTGSTVIESRTTCCDGGGVVDVAGVDHDGAVILARYADRAWLWRPGQDPIALTGAVRPRNVTGIDQWPGGVSWTTGDSSDDPAAFGRVSDGGEVTRVGRVPQAQGGLWSPHGTSYAVAPAHHEGRARPVVWRDGRRQVLRAPRGAWPLAWESEARVLLVDGDLDGSIRLVRCWVTDGRCEQAGPSLRHAQVPDPS